MRTKPEMLYRIESDGTPQGTKVIYQGGEEPVALRGVRAVEWRINQDNVGMAKIEVISVETAALGRPWRTFATSGALEGENGATP